MEIRQLSTFPDHLINASFVPVFATPGYARLLAETKSMKTLWLSGISGDLPLVMIPFTVTTGFLKKGRFLSAPIPLSDTMNIRVEKDFLDSLIEYIKVNKLCDWIQQPPNWAIFNTLPRNVVYCPFGTYKIDLSSKLSPDELFSDIDIKDRNDIKKAMREGVEIKQGVGFIDDSLKLIRETAIKANISYPTPAVLKKELEFLDGNISVYVAYYRNEPQATTIFYSTSYCIYNLYAGSKPNPFRGSNSYLYWQAISDAKTNNIKYFDFVGARINPSPDSKHYRIQKFKEHFGGKLYQGYLWKLVISPLKYKLYNSAVRFVFFMRKRPYKEDLIDQEIERLSGKDSRV